MEFITIDNQKIAKSVGNTISLQQLKDRGISPLAYRYWLLTSHYRQKVNFTWEAVLGAQTALHRALKIFSDLQKDEKLTDAELVEGEYRDRFKRAIYDDVNTAEAIAVMWELLKDERVHATNKRATLIDFDRVLAIGMSDVLQPEAMGRLKVIGRDEISDEAKSLLEGREEARKNEKWADADELRKKIEALGLEIEDTPDGPVLKSKER
jgi:cysteinyl-tRNA synthetase